MSTSYGSTPPGITGTHYGGAGLGVRGDAVPSDGEAGAGYLYAGLSLPADAAKEVRGPITRWPSGTLLVYEDSSFTYDGPPDYALYQLYVDGVASTTDIGYGAGIGRLSLSTGAVITLAEQEVGADLFAALAATQAVTVRLAEQEVGADLFAASVAQSETAAATVTVAEREGADDVLAIRVAAYPTTGTTAAFVFKVPPERRIWIVQ